MMKVLIILLFFFIFAPYAYARSGCCSHHGGVSYCGGNGMYVCSDGVESPTCECSYQPASNYSQGNTQSFDDYVNSLPDNIDEITPTQTPVPTKTFVQFVTDATPGASIFYSGLGVAFGLFLGSFIGLKKD